MVVCTVHFLLPERELSRIGQSRPWVIVRSSTELLVLLLAATFLGRAGLRINGKGVERSSVRGQIRPVNGAAAGAVCAVQQPLPDRHLSKSAGGSGR